MFSCPASLLRKAIRNPIGATAVAIVFAASTSANGQEISPSSGFNASTATSGYSDGDLFIAFFSPTGANDVLFDIGPLSAYQNASPGVTYLISGFDTPADVTGLSNTIGPFGQAEGGVGPFGSSVYWTIAGGNISTRELAVTALQGAGLDNRPSYDPLTVDLATIGSELSGSIGSGNSDYDAILSDRPVYNLMDANGQLSWSNGPLSQAASDTTGTTSLVLWDLDKNDTESGAGIELGTFTFNGSTLEFTAAGTVSSLPPGGGTIVNLSARANVGQGANALVAGFVIQGVGTKNVLLRGVGPTLGTSFDVPGALAQPVLTLTNTANNDTLYTGMAWGGSSTVADVMAQVGAFALPANSDDAAVLESLPASTYTAEVSGVAAGTGIALAEIYDADTGAPAANLVNISARANVDTGADILIAGFVIGGSHSAQVLLRGVGPALGNFSISSPLAQPTVGLFDSNQALIVSDTGWGNALVPGKSAVSASFRLATAADMSNAGAFSLAAGSADCALVATLPPGNYTLQLSGSSGSSGVGLVEVYLLP